MYEQWRIEEPYPSAIQTFPTKEEPEKAYKIIGAWIELGQDLIYVERQTYSFLEWLGDVGGLFEAAV